MLPSIATSTLIVVDIQERLLPAMHEPDQAPLLKNISILLEAFRHFGGHVLVSEQYPQGLGRTVEPLREWCDGMHTIEKTTFSMCRAADYPEHKAAIRDDVILVGIEAHVCVLQTGCDLLLDGKRVWVPFDAVASRRPETRDNGIALLDRHGAVIINTESLLFNELGSSSSEAFKRFSRLIR